MDDTLFGINNPNYKHGETGNKLYFVWQGIKQRILNSNNKKYKDYGGRGITICPEWMLKLTGYLNFRNWALSNGYKDGLQIDRKNTNGNYEPSNCRFITNAENCQNKRNNKIKSLEQANKIRELYKTNKYTMKNLADEYGISKGYISKLINNKKWRNF